MIRARPLLLLILLAALTIGGAFPIAGGVAPAAGPPASSRLHGALGGPGTSFPVTFSETGLPPGSSWSVDLVRNLSASSSRTLGFSEPNGTFNFSVNPFAGWMSQPSGGIVTVSGQGVTVAVDWTPVEFPVNFSESGLPAGTVWSVTVNGSQASSNNTTISLDEPNGTYDFLVVGPSGYSIAPVSSTITVEGPPPTTPIRFASVTGSVYPVTFRESGLPSGTSWAVTLGGRSASSAGTSLAFDEPNGSLAFRIANRSGWHANLYNGTASVLGAAVVVSIVWTSVAYPVRFEETGLPNHTAWAVTFEGALTSTSSSSIAFSEPNGSFEYRIAPITGWRASTYRGNVTVNGSATTLVVTWSVSAYLLRFVEAGLPSGAAWGVTVNGTLAGSSTGSIQFSEPNGSYGFEVSPRAGSSIAPASAAVTVNGSALSVPVAFGPASGSLYELSFTESYLPRGTPWTVSLSGSNATSTGANLSFAEPNGTFTYRVEPVAGWRASSYSGSLTVSGASVALALTWTPVTYAVTFTESGLPSGTLWSVALGGTSSNSSGTSLAFGESNGTYAYVVANVPGWRADAYRGAITVSGVALALSVVWTATTYAVTFTESGLTLPTSWSVTLGGSATASSTAQVAFSEPNGSYAYSIGSIPGYSIAPAAATIAVEGRPVGVAITFAVAAGPTYPVTFTESGLSAGTAWSVTMRGTSTGSTGTRIGYAEPNGTFTFRIGNLSGWHAASYTGSATVSGAPVSVPITWSSVTYALTFTESGLPSTTNWTVKAGATTETARAASIAFSEPNGTLNYTVTDVPGFRASAYAGTLNVQGRSVAVAISWVRVAYSIVFTESGLSNGTAWSVALGGLLVSSTSARVAFAEPNGTFTYRVEPVAGWRASSYSGSLTVSGASVALALTWTPVTYAVTFTESGLPSGTPWSVALGGTSSNSSGTSLAFGESNGTYAYVVANVPGWRADAYRGAITVSGVALALSVVWTATTYAVTFTESGLTLPTSWSVTLGGSATASSTAQVAFSEPNGSYAYSIGSIPGYSIAPAAATIAVEGRPVGVAITFAVAAGPTYPVTFTESGLSAGTAWSVTLGGSAATSVGGTVTFDAANGTIPYNLSNVPGWRANAYAGSVQIAGAGAGVTVTWSRATYPVTFTETGLPTGTSWAVTLAGARTASTGSSIGFSEPNGTFAYLLGTVPGWSTPSFTGNVSVSGGAASLGAAWTRVTYAVTVEEAGLPSGTGWSVTLAGTPGASTGSAIGFVEPNGTYAFTVSGIAGWRADRYSGSVTVNGAAPSTSITWTAVTYSVTFTESGLASSTSWGVTIGGTLRTSATSTIVFAEPNGTSSYLLTNVPGWRTSAYSGPVTVSGGAASISVAWVRSTYSVSFNETGLPTGTSWTVSVNGAPTTSSNRSITVLEPNGTYTYVLSGVAGYQTTTYSGSVTLDGGPVLVTMAWTPVTYTVTFIESGLPVGTSWTVSLNSTALTSTNASILADAPNGTLSYRVLNVPGWRANPSSGNVVVKGSSVAVTIDWARTTYAVTFTEYGLAAGTSWSVVLNGTLGTGTGSSIVFVAPNGSYRFSLGAVPGWRSDRYTGNLAVDGFTAGASFDFTPVTFAVTLFEIGLPIGTGWTASVDGVAGSSNSTLITFFEGNGTHAFLVLSVPGWRSDRSSGNLTVRGSATSGEVNWTRMTYPVNVTESGLPAGYDWTVTVAGILASSSGSAVSFSEPNGSFPFVIGNVSGWAVAAYSGALTVAGAPVGLSVAWTRVTYRIAFSPSGLAPGTSWSVTLNGNASSASDAPIVFDVPNGTLVYRISALSGWRTTSYSGKITVDDAPLDLAIAWTPQTYPVTFTESGLPSGTSWSVALNGTLASSSDPTLVLDGINGSLPYVLSDLPGWRAKVYDGTVTVNGGPAGVSVLWTPVTYPVTFTQSDLPDGTTWAVTLGGQTITSANATITFRVANGSYPYTVTAPDGYAVTPAAGTVVVTAAASAQSIGFHARAGGASTFLGLPTSGGLGMLWGALLALLIVALALLLWTRMGRRGGRTSLGLPSRRGPAPRDRRPSSGRAPPAAVEPASLAAPDADVAIPAMPEPAEGGEALPYPAETTGAAPVPEPPASHRPSSRRRRSRRPSPRREPTRNPRRLPTPSGPPRRPNRWPSPPRSQARPRPSSRSLSRPPRRNRPPRSHGSGPRSPRARRIRDARCPRK